jgi:hypothetical protein
MNSTALLNPLVKALPTTSATAPLLSRSRQHRFTRDGDDALENLLHELCCEVATGVSEVIPSHLLQGLLLAGGYGRGEGGVLRTKTGDAPYNDLEFYVFVKGQRLIQERRFGHALHELGERLSLQAGIEVEFKLLSLADLRNGSVSMFSYDFVSGHQWILGDETLFQGCDHHTDATHIPVHEATRLLFNRCSGLLFAAARLKHRVFTAEDADFVGRNLAKAQLGLGDALLAAEGQYHWSCLERHARLRQRAGNDVDRELVREHAEGVVFKLHPLRTQLSRETLAAKHRELTALAWQVWRKVESARLGTEFNTPAEYAERIADKCPDQPAWRNTLVNLRAFGWRSLTHEGASVYPRQRLYHAMTLLLWGDAWLPSILKRVQRELRSEAPDFRRLVEAYEPLWKRFN